jgi:hypothetical protein
MPPENSPPPRIPPFCADRKYYDFMRMVRFAPEDSPWVSIPLDEVNGSTTIRKQSSMHEAAKNRGFKVQTTVQAGRIYARSVTPRPPYLRSPSLPHPQPTEGQS